MHLGGFDVDVPLAIAFLYDAHELGHGDGEDGKFGGNFQQGNLGDVCHAGFKVCDEVSKGRGGRLAQGLCDGLQAWALLGV